MASMFRFKYLLARSVLVDAVQGPSSPDNTVSNTFYRALSIRDMHGEVSCHEFKFSLLLASELRRGAPYCTTHCANKTALSTASALSSHTGHISWCCLKTEIPQLSATMPGLTSLERCAQLENSPTPHSSSIVPLSCATTTCTRSWRA